MWQQRRTTARSRPIDTSSVIEFTPRAIAPPVELAAPRQSPTRWALRRLRPPSPKRQRWATSRCRRRSIASSATKRSSTSPRSIPNSRPCSSIRRRRRRRRWCVPATRCAAFIAPADSRCWHRRRRRSSSACSDCRNAARPLPGAALPVLARAIAGLTTLALRVKHREAFVATDEVEAAEIVAELETLRQEATPEPRWMTARRSPSASPKPRSWRWRSRRRPSRWHPFLSRCRHRSKPSSRRQRRNHAGRIDFVGDGGSARIGRDD